MKLINSNVELVKEANPYKKVELVGRTCYKSEDKITDDSYKIFFKNLVTRRHMAMLEHGVVTFLITGLETLPQTMFQIPYLVITPLGEGYKMNWIISASLSHIYNDWDEALPRDSVTVAILICMKQLCEQFYQENGTNFIQMFSNLCTMSIVDNLPQIQEQFPESPILEKHQFISMKFTCDRGVSHELVRHRCSVAQSSTRYCDYSKGKFGSEITFVKPAEYDSWPEEHKKYFEDFLQNCEETYMWMRDKGYQPQQARAVLPNALMTEVILTMSAKQWAHFLNLRYFGITGNPHPDMKIVAEKAYHIFSDEFDGKFQDTEEASEEVDSTNNQDNK